MNLDEIAPQLAGVMDAVSVCEGLIFAKETGEVLMGQTLDASIDHSVIAKNVCQLFSMDLKVIKKGDIIDYTISLDKGFLIAVRSKEHVLIGILGSDGKSSVGLLARQIKNIMRH
ncbi:MAG: hypothetical protein ACTSYI_14810 [Promethearchaeota archaeon]